MKKQIFFIFFIAVIFHLTAQKPLKTPRTYIAKKIVVPLKIDGKQNETAWQNAQWTADFIDIEGEKKPRYRTRVKNALGC